MKFGILGINELWLKFIIGINNILGVKFSKTLFYKITYSSFFCEHYLDVHLEAFIKMQNLKI